MKKKKRKINYIKVLIALILLIIIIGGIIMYLKKDNKSNLNTNNNTTNNSEKDKTADNDNNNNDKDNSTTETNSNLEPSPANSEEFKKLADGEYLTSKGFTLTIKDGSAYVEDHLIVNKTYSLPADYKPTNPAVPITGERCENCINKDVMDAFKLMQADATSVGLNIYIASGYRSYKYQERLYNNYSAVSGIEGADTYSARAGYSEHQTGLCFDLNSVDDSFANTAEGKWINNNAHLYGFVIRYPKGKENITGYQYESWHLRYVGKTLAEKLYNNGNWLTIEEYYGLSSSYQ